MWHIFHIFTKWSEIFRNCQKLKFFGVWSKHLRIFLNLQSSLIIFGTFQKLLGNISVAFGKCLESAIFITSSIGTLLLTAATVDPPRTEWPFSQCQYKHSVRPCAVIGLEWVQWSDYVWHKLRWGEKLCNCKIVAQSNNDTETLIKLNQHFPNSNEILGISEWVLVNSLVLRG